MASRKWQRRRAERFHPQAVDARTRHARFARSAASIDVAGGLRDSQPFHDPAAGRCVSDPAAGVDLPPPEGEADVRPGDRTAVGEVLARHVADVVRACDPDR